MYIYQRYAYSGDFHCFHFSSSILFNFRIYSYALSNLFLLQFSSYNLFILPDICTFKKVGHIIIYERWIYYQDFYFKFSQNTADMFKYNDIIHLCHEYEFDDKICSLQKQLQILYLAKDIFFDFLKLLKKKNDPQYEKIEHTNVVIRIRKSKYRQYNNGQKRKDKQRSTKYYTKN
jgi:hypothetical protein